MIFTGKFITVNRDWQTGQYNITFTVNEPSVLEQIEHIQSCERLSIEAKKFRKKRSLDANAYLWILCTKIADVVKSSKDEIYEQMLQRYGYFYQDDDGYITVTVKNEVDMSKISGHWKFLKTNGKFASYLMIKGTSEYDTKEMSYFIDCVVSEAKELGIETLPPDELKRMVALWKA